MPNKNLLFPIYHFYPVPTDKNSIGKFGQNLRIFIKLKPWELLELFCKYSPPRIVFIFPMHQIHF